MLDASSWGRGGRDTGSIFNFGHLGLKEQKELIWIPTVIKSQADTTLRYCSARNEWHARETGDQLVRRRAETWRAWPRQGRPAGSGILPNGQWCICSARCVLSGR